MLAPGREIRDVPAPGGRRCGRLPPQRETVRVDKDGVPGRGRLRESHDGDDRPLRCPRDELVVEAGVRGDLGRGEAHVGVRLRDFLDGGGVTGDEAERPRGCAPVGRLCDCAVREVVNEPPGDGVARGVVVHGVGRGSPERRRLGACGHDGFVFGGRGEARDAERRSRAHEGEHVDEAATEGVEHLPVHLGAVGEAVGDESEHEVSLLVGVLPLDLRAQPPISASPSSASGAFCPTA